MKCNGSGKQVIYPDGGAKFNLAPDTYVWNDGELKSAFR
jgi:hypothetical protein